MAASTLATATSDFILRLGSLTFGILTLLATMNDASVMQYSIGDVYVEMQSWGTIVVGRYNGSNIFYHDLEYSRLKLKPLQISLLDAGHNVISSHDFASERSQEFQIDQWEGAKYDRLGASGRRLSTLSLGDLSGQLHFATYIFTEGGKLETISLDYHQDVSTTDILFEVSISNVTRCPKCHGAEFVELHIQVMGGANDLPQVMMKDLGDIQLDNIHIPSSAFITASNMGTLDGVHVQLPPGFPEVEDEPDGIDIIVRFPKFSSSAKYRLLIKQDRRTPKQVKEEIMRENNKQLQDKHLNVVQNGVSIQMRSASSGQQTTHEYSYFINLLLVCFITSTHIFNTRNTQLW